jgi:hypothetical protein
LNLIENKSYLAFRCHCPQAAKKIGIEYAHSALTLDRLDNYRGDSFSIENGIEITEVALTDGNSTG